MNCFLYLFTVLTEGFVIGLSYLLLFLPLLYLNTHENRVIYGSVMTAILTIGISIIHFFRIIRPITRLNNMIKQTQRSIISSYDFSHTLRNENRGFGNISFNNNNNNNNMRSGENTSGDDFLDEKRRIEKVLHSMGTPRKILCHYVQEQQTSIEELLTSVLKWQGNFIDRCQKKCEDCMKLTQDVHRRGNSIRANSNNNSNNNNNRERGIIQENNQTHFLPFTPLMAQDELSANEGKKLENVLPKKSSPERRHEDPVAFPNKLSENNLKLHSPDNNNNNNDNNNKVHYRIKKKFPITKNDVISSSPISNTGTETTFTLSGNNSQHISDKVNNKKKSKEEDKELRPVNTVSSFKASRSMGSSLIPQDTNTQQYNESNLLPSLVTLSRGNRFATDNQKVFLHIIINNPNNNSEKIIAFEAILDHKNTNLKLGDGINNEIVILDELTPFKGFTVTTNGKREPLSAEDETLTGIISCEIELNSFQNTFNRDSSKLLPHHHHQLIESKDNNIKIRKENRRAFIVAFAFLPEFPMRLTVLPVRLINSEKTSPVPVLECMIDDTFCILTSAIISVESNNNNNNNIDRVVSVELRGISIEDESDEEGSIAPRSSLISGTFGTSVRAVINL